MKYIKQFGIILAITFGAELMSYLIPLPIPASIYGIGILFAGLQTGFIPLSAVEDVGNFLVQIMPIMFVPAAVGLMNSWGLVKNSLFTYLFVIALSTVVVMAVSGKVTEKMVKHPVPEQQEGESEHV